MIHAAMISAVWLTKREPPMSMISSPYRDANGMRERTAGLLLRLRETRQRVPMARHEDGGGLSPGAIAGIRSAWDSGTVTGPYETFQPCHD